jgi:MarR family transcriptional regulator, organic hydroperoxide resistance regulator
MGKGQPPATGGPASWPDPGLAPVMRAWGRTMGAVGAAAGPFFGDLDITTAQMRVLGQLKQHGRMTGRDLAARLGVTPGTVIPLLDRLEERGYLRRVPGQADRRLTWLELTPAGEEFFRGLWLAAGKTVAQAIAQLTPQDRQALERLLNQIADYLERAAQAPASPQPLRPAPDTTAGPPRHDPGPGT